MSCLNRAGPPPSISLASASARSARSLAKTPDRLRVEVTTYRREAYPDEHRFPEVAFDATLIDDLARRDFTMNAIAVDAGFRRDVRSLGW